MIIVFRQLATPLAFYTVSLAIDMSTDTGVATMIVSDQKMQHTCHTGDSSFT